MPAKAGIQYLILDSDFRQNDSEKFHSERHSSCHAELVSASRINHIVGLLVCDSEADLLLHKP